jgi:hypothetical protein
MRTFLLFLTRFLRAPRVIMGGDGATPYLSRWYLYGKQPQVDEHGNPVKNARPVGTIGTEVYLHRFHRSDADRELHNHPWRVALVFVLSGGYVEQYRDGDKVKTRVRNPGSVFFLRGEDFHRVDLIGGDSWSLFIAGQKASSWSFWCAERKERAHWREFLAWKQDGGAEPTWVDDRREGETK